MILTQCSQRVVGLVNQPVEYIIPLKKMTQPAYAQVSLSFVSTVTGWLRPTGDFVCLGPKNSLVP